MIRYLRALFALALLTFSPVPALAQMSFSGGASVGCAILAQGGGASHTGDLNETTLASVTVPGNAMGKNGRLIVETQWAWTGTAGGKTIKVKLGSATLLNAGNAATTLADRRTTIIQNQNATGSQSTSIGGFVGAQTSSAWNVSSSIDTTVAQTAAITSTAGSAADTVTLVGWQFLLCPHG